MALTTRWITVVLRSGIEADLPDTEGNRAACKRVVSEWVQTFEGGKVVSCTKPPIPIFTGVIEYRHSPFGVLKSVTFSNFRGTREQAEERVRELKGKDIFLY